MRETDFKKKTDERIMQLKAGSVPLLYFPLLQQIPFVGHGFTTREGGVSEGMFSSLNLSFTRGDRREAVEENFKRLAAALGVSYGDFVFSDQTHTTNILRVGKEHRGCGLTKERGYSDIDGLITNEPNVALSTFYADCVPLFFVDPVHHAIGLSHSGWRGTAGRMGAATLSAMNREFGTLPEEVFAAIGPSICQDCYEVSGDAAEVFQKEFPAYQNAVLKPHGAGKYLLDLWKCNEIVLLEAGVCRVHLAAANICTCCNPKLLFSHRASHGKRGNLGAFLFLKD